MSRIYWPGLIIINILLLSASWATQPAPAHAGRAPSLYLQQRTETLFTDVAAATGAQLEHRGAAPVMPLGGGVAFGDYDNDGWLDIYVTNQGGSNALYRNQGDGTFVDQAAAAGVTAPDAIGSGALFGDYDNDGWRDLYVVNLGGNLLFHNNGNGTFTDVTDAAGVGDEGFGQSAVWGDYDNDGWIDLYVVNHMGPDDSADRLYHNEGNGQFRDVSSLLSAHLRAAAGFAASFVDYDDDGDVDLYVVNDVTFGDHRENVLWQNEGPGQDGLWRFRDVSTRARANIALNGMGLAVGDFDNDADQDFAMTNIGPNVLLANTGRGQFQDISQAAGIRRERLPGDREPLTWCALSFDYDNDGWLDLFLCGSPLDKGDGLPSALFHNLQDGGTFADVSDQSGMTGEYWTRAGAYGDFDRDGAVDFYVVNYDQPAALYHNNNVHNNNVGANWLTVRLAGVLSNRDALGAKVRLTTIDQSGVGQTQVRQIQSGGSLGAGNDIAAYFGLGNAAMVERLEIDWPSGLTQVLTDLPINRAISVTEALTSTLENDLRLEVLNLPQTGMLVCGEEFALEIRVHNLGRELLKSSEVVYGVGDYSGRTLIGESVILPDIPAFGAQIVWFSSWVPAMNESYHLHLSSRSAEDLPDGPLKNHMNVDLDTATFIDRSFDAGLIEEEPGVAIATGDFNRDGYTDIYLVNNSRPNQLYFNNGDGAFRNVTAAAGVGHTGLGSGAVVADFNQDGAPDIYLLNLDEDNVYYQNRGNGTFTNLTGIAGMSHRGTSRAAVDADFDDDGDLDIYLVNDGQANLLLLNQGDGTFIAAPESVGLTDRGGGRNAVARDFDGDGDIDIYLVKDREANVLYLNRDDGTFEIAPSDTSAADTGRGRAAVAADFDGDGDQDLYVANLAEVNRLYVNQGDGAFRDGSIESGLDDAADATVDAKVADFNGDGWPDLVVANAGGQPNIVYLNQGDGHFARASAAFGANDDANSVAAAVADFNNDGSSDLYIVNANLPDQLYFNSSPQSEGCW